MLNEILFTKIQEEDIGNIWFQQDGAMYHTAEDTCFWCFPPSFWKSRDLQFNVDSERQIFEKLFHGRFILLSEFLLEIWWEEVAYELFFFFIFRFDA